MKYTASIPAGPLPNTGVDFGKLKERGVALTQKWSGRNWTDYNEHDPGVTTLEQLCYALTDLSFRADKPIEDLLARSRSGEIDGRALGLYRAPEALSVNPVTIADYRKLLLDRIPELSNIWLVPVSTQDARGIDGLYDVVMAPLDELEPGLRDNRGNGPDRASDTRNGAVDEGIDDHGHGFHHHHHHHEHLRKRVKAVYSAHRNLCEDLRHITRLRGIPITIEARLSIEDKGDPSDILAEVYFALNQLFAPEPRRRSLRHALTEGLMPAEILDGPLLWEGLIAADQLQPRQEVFRGFDLNAAILSVPGVTGLKALRVLGEHGKVLLDSPSGSFCVPENGIFLVWPTRTCERSEYSIKLSRKGVTLPGRQQVLERFRQLRRTQRQRYDLAAQYDLFLGFPTGHRLDLKRYSSVQNQFPAVYGIGQDGPPAYASSMRLAQARQLKGYLLPFEQLLTDFFAQLAHIPDLFAISPDQLRTYFWQSLVPDVPDVEPLLIPGYEEALDRIVSEQDDALLRRSLFLDFTLSLYAEEIDLSPLANMLGVAEPQLLEMNARQIMLRYFLDLSSRRGAAAVRASPANRDEPSGMLIRSRIELGIPPFLDRHGSEDDRAGEHHHHHHHHDHGAALYLIENSRMALGRPGHRCRHHQNMTVTALLYPGEDLRDPHDYIELARLVVRRNTPCHIAVDFRVLCHERHEAFESLYRRWIEAGDGEDAAGFAELCDALVPFLEVE